MMLTKDNLKKGLEQFAKEYRGAEGDLRRREIDFSTFECIRKYVLFDTEFSLYYKYYEELKLNDVKEPTENRKGGK